MRRRKAGHPASKPAAGIARVDPQETGLAQFDPQETAVRLAQGDAVIGFAKQMKDWPLLERATEQKLDEQAAFVAWWQTAVRPASRPKKTVRDPGQLSVGQAERQTHIRKQQVARWNAQLEDRAHYKAAILGAAYRAAQLTPDDRLDPLMSSATAEWATPQDLFDLLHTEFHLTLDVCATRKNAKCPRFFTAKEDGLQQAWAPARCWMNPPYGDVIADWMEKAAEETRAGALVVCLVPARTDTAWWWKNARYGEVRFLRGRLHFGEGGTAPFPSAVVVLGRPPAVVWWDAWPP
jgi:site-specific DNA-methyltransferase (adenine-specific)